LPIEDVERVLDLQDSIVRLPCLCRSLLKGSPSRYCFGLGIDTVGILGKYPDFSDFEVMEKEEAKKLVRSFDKEGLVHSVWTFKTPYIGGLCNCGQDCVAHRVQVKENLMQTMFRAEYVSLVNRDLCNGCKECVSKCQFGAIRFSNSSGKAVIELMKCYGCGVCRTFCDRSAITMKPRNELKGLPW
jgi:ferredoxin